MKHYIFVCGLLLVGSPNVQAGCAPGKNICNILGEGAARAFDAQQARINEQTERMVEQTEALEEQNRLLEEHNAFIKKQNEIQMEERAYQILKEVEEERLARLKDGTAEYTEDDNSPYCQMYGRCNSAALKTKWKKFHSQ